MSTTSPAPDSTPARPRRRVFRWVFLAVQILFLVWIVGGACQADSNNSAEVVGAGIGVMLIVLLWLAVDAILAVTYLIFRKR